MRRRIEDIKCEPGLEFDYFIIKYILSRAPTLYRVPTPRQLNFLRTTINNYNKKTGSKSYRDLWKQFNPAFNDDLEELGSIDENEFFNDVFIQSEQYPIKVRSDDGYYITIFENRLQNLFQQLIPYHPGWKQTYQKPLSENQFFWFDIANPEWCYFERNFDDNCITDYAIWEVYFYDKSKSDAHEEIDIIVDDVPNTRRGYFKRRCREDDLWGYDYFINFYDIDQGKFFPIDKITIFRLISVCYRVAGDKEIIGDFIHQVSAYEEAMREERRDSQKRNYPDYSNSRYYNDNLDLDQQSPEFWDDI